eukprot:29886_1
MIAVFLTFHLILVSISAIGPFKLKLKTEDIMNVSGKNLKGMYYQLICADASKKETEFYSYKHGEQQLSTFNIDDGASNYKIKIWEITTEEYFDWCHLYIMENKTFGDKEWGKANDDEFWRALQSNPSYED